MENTKLFVTRSLFAVRMVGRPDVVTSIRKALGDKVGILGDGDVDLLQLSVEKRTLTGPKAKPGEHVFVATPNQTLIGYEVPGVRVEIDVKLDKRDQHIRVADRDTGLVLLIRVHPDSEIVQ